MKQKIKRSIRVSKYILYKETLFDAKEHIWTFIGSFLGIGAIAYLNTFSLTQLENIFLIGSFGASSVLIYGAIHSPLAQPRNLIGGHVFSALIGVTVFKIFPDTIWISAPLAVSLSIVLMQITKTLHPPGGATALIATIGTEKIKTLGYFYVISPVLSGAIILLLVALIINNITPTRSYPSSRKFTRMFKRKKVLENQTSKT
jgi:CBS-domain-containing membrane protein